MDEGVVWTGERRLHFDYRDAEGEESRRDLVLQRIYLENGQTYLEGFSVKRHAQRTFRHDRVRGKFVDAESGEVGTLKDLCPFQEIPSPRATRKGKRSKSPPAGLPKVEGTTRLSVDDQTDYHGLLRDYFTPAERKRATTADILEELDPFDFELEVEPFDSFFTREMKGAGVPPDLRASELLDTFFDDDGEARFLVPQDHPSLSDGLFRDVGPPGAGDLDQLKVSDLKEMLKKSAEKLSGKKVELIERLMPHVGSLGLRVAELDKQAAHETWRKLSMAYVAQIIEIGKPLPAAYTVALLEDIPDEPIHPTAIAHARKLQSAAERKADGPAPVSAAQRKADRPMPVSAAGPARAASPPLLDAALRFLRGLWSSGPRRR